MAHGPFRPIFRAGSFLTVAAFSVAAGCSPIVRNHGYVPPPDELAEVAVGQDTRDTVAEKIGAPLNTSFQRDSAWYYISSRRQTIGFFAPEEMDRQILAIEFTEAGRVENIRSYGLKDGQVVVLTSRVTDSAVKDIGFLRSAFGNVGTPTAEDFL